MGGLFSQRLARLGSQNEFKIADDIAKAEAMGQQVIRLNLGEPDNDSADNINKCAIDNIKSGNTHYCDPQGVLAFRESIADLSVKPGILMFLRIKYWSLPEENHPLLLAF